MITMNNFKAEPIELREAMLGAVKRVLDSGWYVLGNELLGFERQWASACGVTHGVGVGNGMDAIEIALRALDIGPGDEVITSPMTAFATVLAIIRAGAVPVLADIEPESALLSTASVHRCLSPRTRAVLLVHLYGQVRGMEGWLTICREHGVALIEDCAQAHLASSGGKVAGSFGVAGAYSFYPTKNLGTPGDAGMLVTNDEVLADRACYFRNYGQSIRYHHPVLGMNSRMDEIHAAMLVERLNWLPEFTLRRQQIAGAYRAGISNAAFCLMASPEVPEAHVYHLFVLTCEHRDELQLFLLAQGVQALIHYPIPVHKQLPGAKLRRDPEGLTASEHHAANCLSLPCHPQMTDDDVRYVIAVVNAFRID